MRAYIRVTQACVRTFPFLICLLSPLICFFNTFSFSGYLQGMDGKQGCLRSIQTNGRLTIVFEPASSENFSEGLWEIVPVSFYSLFHLPIRLADAILGEYDVNRVDCAVKRCFGSMTTGPVNQSWLKRLDNGRFDIP